MCVCVMAQRGCTVGSPQGAASIQLRSLTYVLPRMFLSWVRVVVVEVCEASLTCGINITALQRGFIDFVVLIVAAMAVVVVVILFVAVMSAIVVVVE